VPDVIKFVLRYRERNLLRDGARCWLLLATSLKKSFRSCSPGPASYCEAWRKNTSVIGRWRMSCSFWSFQPFPSFRGQNEMILFTKGGEETVASGKRIYCKWCFGKWCILHCF
jgi:hypothetical protein